MFVHHISHIYLLLRSIYTGTRSIIQNQVKGTAASSEGPSYMMAIFDNMDGMENVGGRIHPYALLLVIKSPSTL